MSEAVGSEFSNPLEVEPIAVLRVDDAKTWEMVEPDLPVEVQQRMQVIQRLLAAEGTKTYGKVQRHLARELGISVRSLQRLVKRWRERGLAGLKKQERSDRGEVKITQDWKEFVIKTYRDGNRGSRSISRAQVWLRGKARAAQQGTEAYPGDRCKDGRPESHWAMGSRMHCPVAVARGT